MKDQRARRELDLNFEETAGLTEEAFDSEEATTIMNVSEMNVGASQIMSINSVL